MRQKINHLAVWILAVVQQGVGFLWYSKWLFGPRWTDLQGKTAEDFHHENALPFVMGVLAALAITYLFAWLLIRMDVKRVSEGIVLALILWVSLIFFPLAVHFSFMGYTFELILINAGYWFVNLLTVSFVLSTSKKRRQLFAKKH